MVKDAPAEEARPVDIRRIVCPIDFSETSRHALEHAVAIAKWYQAHITALHVIPRQRFPQPPIFFAEPPHGVTPTPAERRALEEQLRAWLAAATQAGVKTDLLVDEGSPAHRILDHASRLGADLLTMGTHGLSGFERFALGSVAEKVLRKAACPVMTVPPAAAAEVKVPYTRLLCPLDFSESSLAAFQFAVSIAKESDAHLTLLHVFDWPADDELLVEHFDAPETRRVVEATARARLDALVTDDARVWCKSATRVGYGKPYRQILEVADSEGTDLIVIGVRGRNPLDLALFGSTTNHVVRRASCPVLTLKS